MRTICHYSQAYKHTNPRNLVGMWLGLTDLYVCAQSRALWTNNLTPKPSYAIRMRYAAAHNVRIDRAIWELGCLQN